MKILIVSHEYPPIGGGGANACMNLAREYVSSGHIVDIVTAWYKGESERLENGSLTIYRLKTNRKHAEHSSFTEMLDFLLKAMPFVDGLAKSNGYDICQVFFGIPSGPVGYRLKKKYGLPYVIRFGGGDIPGFQDRFANVYKLIGPAIKLIWKNADALVANSEGLRKMAWSFYGKKEIKIIPNGAEIHNCIKEKGDCSNNKSSVNLLFVSRLIERKGLQDIIPQIGDVRNRCLEAGKDIRLQIVGDGPYRSTLEQMVATKGIGDIVTFYGQKNKSELPQYYEDADLFIFPSRKEGMPNVVLEAMSYGLPIIMTPCQGSEELIDGNGTVTEPEDFGDRIVELVMDSDLRLSLGRKSLQIIRDSFVWNKVADSYIFLFEEIVKTRAMY